MGRVLWLPDTLREWGLTVQVQPSFASAGSSAFYPRGVVCHHTASNPPANIPALGTVTNGRPDLPPPLCHVLLGRDGLAVCVASGRANHAGTGGWRGLTGNSTVMGIEAENNGTGEPWPEEQIAAYLLVCAAMVVGLGTSTDLVCYHREWAPSRKPDPAGPGIPQDGNTWRALVAATIENGGTDVPLTKEDLFAIGVTVKRCLADEGVATDADVDKRAEALKAQATRHNQGAQDRHAETLAVLERIATKLDA